MSVQRFVAAQNDFFVSLASPHQLLDLFDDLPGVSLFIKDSAGKYMHVNDEMAEMLGVQEPQQIVGKTDFDIFPPAVAARYVDQDQCIIGAGEPLINQRGFMPGGDGLPRWFVFSKYPLFNRQGEVAGVAGVKHTCEMLGGSGSSRYGRLTNVVEFVTQHYSEPIQVADLAKQIDLSVSQLQREFIRVLGISPVRYVQEVRIGVARHKLRTTDVDMATIAADCGFYDQSHFSRQFKSSIGLTPMQYRVQNFQS